MPKPPYKKPANLRELIQQVCLRPAMFAGVERFDWAVVYIYGYHAAASEFLPEAYPPTGLSEFSRWLAERFDYPRNYGWGEVRAVFPDDEAAFTQLPLLYDEFINREQQDAGGAA